MKTINTISPDVNRACDVHQFEVHQGDKDSREYHIILTNNAQPVTLTGTMTASADAVINDVIVAQDEALTVDTTNQYIVLTLTEEMLSMAGILKVDVKLSESGAVLTAATLSFYVGQSVINSESRIEPGGTTVGQRLTALESGKADKATTLAGYGITDAYTKTNTYSKTEVNNMLEQVSGVRTDMDQGLNDTQKATARGNIDAASVGEVSDLKSALNGIETDLFTISDNLFNIDDIYTNKVPGSVGSSYDTMVTLNGWYTSNYIPVTDGEQYALIYLSTITQGAIFRIACYSNGIMTYKTSGSTEPNPFTIPSGVDHVRFYSNTANLFNNRTNTSFKKYSADMSMAWAPYGKQENFLVKGSMPEYGVYVDGTNYYHFVRFGTKTLIRLFKREGPNNLFQFSALYTGEVSEYGVSINETIATNGTDTVGPISIMRQGTDSGGMWSGGWHTRTVNNVACPTAKQDSLDIKVNGESIIGSNGLHYGECVATVVNSLYFPQTITGSDLSTATKAIEETVQYMLSDTMKARVSHKYVADTRVIRYYGLQAIRIGFDNILLPDNEISLVFNDLSSDYLLEKSENLMQMRNSAWNYDLLLKPYGLAKLTHNPGTGQTKYGSIPQSTRKVYWVLIEGAYGYTFITTGKVLSWEGEWNIYPN